MEPRIALTTPCEPEFSWVLDLAHDQYGTAALDIRIDGLGGQSEQLISRIVDPFLSRPTAMRFHFPLGGIEVGGPDEASDASGLTGAKEVIDALPGQGERLLTVHLPLCSDATPKQLASAGQRLHDVVQYGRERGVTVCLENLRWGITSDPAVFIDLIEYSGAGVTFDIGHANSSEFAQAGFSSERFAELVSAYVRNAHVYEREDTCHHAPTDLARIGPTLEILLQTGCDWWVIELFDREEVVATRSLLMEFLSMRRMPLPFRGKGAAESLSAILDVAGAEALRAPVS